MPKEHNQLQQQQPVQQPLIQVQQQEQQLAPELQMNDQQIEQRLQQMEQQLDQQAQQEQQEQPVAAPPQQVQANHAGRKAAVRPQTAEEQAAYARERQRRMAEFADRRTVFVDKVRHGFYGAVKSVVTLWKNVTGQNTVGRRVQRGNPHTPDGPGQPTANATRRQTYQNTPYRESLLVAYDKLVAERLAAEGDEAKMMEFERKHGAQFRQLQTEYDRVCAEVREQMEREARQRNQPPPREDVPPEAPEPAQPVEKTEKKEQKREETPPPAPESVQQEEQKDAQPATQQVQQQAQPIQLDQQELQRRQVEALQRREVVITLGNQQRANVVGGTKPAAIQYGTDGSKWLVKESVSCLGLDAPDAAIVTEAGYKIQKLVNPDTAIEAFKGRQVGKGVVSYQRMVQGVKNDDVDLFKFSRTPEALTDQELARVQELAPQILREHTTDWLLCNFDTKGENFLIANDGIGQDRVYGIDKEAAFRPILDEGAQHMSKDYCRFDQNTVYNRLFQQFASGKMNMNLHQVLPQIQRVESMSDADYMGIFADFVHQKERQYGADSPIVEKICQNILARKANLRMEYRDFFTKLVEERCANVSPMEVEALRLQYFGAADGGTFLFAGETVEQFRAERARRIEMRNENQAEREERARKADAADEASYKRRHFLYDTSKTLVMGVKSILNVFKEKKPEQRTTSIPLSQVRVLNQDDPDYNPEFMATYQQKMAEIQQQAHGNAEELQRLMDTTMIDLRMTRDEEIHLGGTKPMSQYIGADGSKWLTKQAVNCLGFYKPEGALLTEAGAKLQKIVDEKTAVDAFVGRTQKHGEVSFQRRLNNVESGPNKLDLFRFSKHPELATPETIQQVQELAPQILREHTTDWLLCNFDTKGENFIITMDQDQRVLHGIDKEAAFNKILDPQAQHMSTDYRPHANDTLYNVIFRMYANNDMEFDLFSVLPQIEKIEAAGSETEYMSTFNSYLQHVAQTKPQQYEAIYGNIAQRRQNLREEYCNFFTRLVNERCKKLHPNEAEALKQRYFGTNGMRFRFP